MTQYRYMAQTDETQGMLDTLRAMQEASEHVSALYASVVNVPVAELADRSWMLAKVEGEEALRLVTWAQGRDARGHETLRLVEVARFEEKPTPQDLEWALVEFESNWKTQETAAWDLERAQGSEPIWARLGEHLTRWAMAGTGAATMAVGVLAGAPVVAGLGALTAGYALFRSTYDLLNSLTPEAPQWEVESKGTTHPAFEHFVRETVAAKGEVQEVTEEVEGGVDV